MCYGFHTVFIFKKRLEVGALVDGLNNGKGDPTMFHAADLQASELCDRWDRYTFRKCRFDRVRDSVHVVSPGTTFAVLAVASLAVFAVSIEIRCSCAPTTVLDSEDDHFPLPGDLVALVDRISSSHVVSTDCRVRTFDLGYSTTGSVFPASEMGVGWKRDDT